MTLDDESPESIKILQSVLTFSVAISYLKVKNIAIITSQVNHVE